MKKQLINYETLIKITGAISSTRDPEEVVVLTVENVKTAMDVKGCTLFLIDRKTDELCRYCNILLEDALKKDMA